MVRLSPARARTLACRAEEPPEEREARFRRLAAARESLLTAVGGCKSTLDTLLDLVWGRVGMTEAAGAAGWSVSTVSRKVRGALERLRCVARLAAAADRHLAAGAGFTIDPATAALVGSVSAWAVSLGHLGLRLPGRPTYDDLLGFLASRIDVLLLGRGRRRYFGGWVEKSGACWLDVSVLITGWEAAVAFARRNGQRALTFLATGEEVVLAHRDGRRAA